MMKIKGRLLKFDQVILNDHIFSKDCKINIPDKVPVVWDFDLDEVNKVYGMAHVERNKDGLIFTADIVDGASDIVKAVQNECGIGGYYGNVRYHKLCIGEQYGHHEYRIVDEASLKAVSITPAPVNKDYDYEIIYEENLHTGGNK